jgi:orotate phosphoribosyltransferase
MTREQKVAQILLSVGAVGFSFQKPIRFKSGILSPMYVDNRKLPYYPEQWDTIITESESMIRDKNLMYEVIASVELGGVSHASVLGFCMGVPSVIVRKKIKDHGAQKRIEGGPVVNKKVLSFEDLITTGGSSLESIKVLRDEGAIVTDCISIVSYDFKEAREAFAQANVELHTLISFSVIVQEALKMEKITEIQYENLYSWHIDPHGWTKEKESTVFK